MAGAYLSESLRKQRMQEEYGAMLQTQLARQAASQIMGQVAQQEVGIGVQQEQALGNTLEKAAGRQSNRKVGRTQLEMAQSINDRKKKYGLIGAAAQAAGALGSYLALSGGDEAGQNFSTPAGELTTSDFESRFIEGAQNDLVPSVSDQLDTSVPQHFEEPPSVPQGELELSGDSSLTPGKFVSRPASLEPPAYTDDTPWMEPLPPIPMEGGPSGALVPAPMGGPRRIPEYYGEARDNLSSTADTAMMERMRLLELLKGRM